MNNWKRSVLPGGLAAKAAGLRVNVFWSDDHEEAKRFLEMGVDTILTNDYLPISAATGLE